MKHFEMQEINGERLAMRLSEVEDVAIQEVDGRMCLCISAENGCVAASADLKDIVKYLFKKEPYLMEQAREEYINLYAQQQQDARNEAIKDFACQVGYEVCGWIDFGAPLPDVKSIVENRFSNYMRNANNGWNELEHKKAFALIVGRESTNWITPGSQVPDVNEIIESMLLSAAKIKM